MIFYALAIYGMLNNVKQNAERMSGFIGVKMFPSVLVEFSSFATDDGLAPSALMRKLATDYVNSRRQINAVPPAPQVRSAKQQQPPQPSSPWDI